MALLDSLINRNLSSSCIRLSTSGLSFSGTRYGFNRFGLKSNDTMISCCILSQHPGVSEKQSENSSSTSENSARCCIVK